MTQLELITPPDVFLRRSSRKVMICYENDNYIEEIKKEYEQKASNSMFAGVSLYRPVATTSHIHWIATISPYIEDVYINVTDNSDPLMLSFVCGYFANNPDKSIFYLDENRVLESNKVIDNLMESCAVELNHQLFFDSIFGVGTKLHKYWDNNLTQ